MIMANMKEFMKKVDEALVKAVMATGEVGIAGLEQAVSLIEHGVPIQTHYSDPETGELKTDPSLFIQTGLLGQFGLARGGVTSAIKSAWARANTVVVKKYMKLLDDDIKLRGKPEWNKNMELIENMEKTHPQLKKIGIEHKYNQLLEKDISLRGTREWNRNMEQIETMEELYPYLRQLGLETAEARVAGRGAVSEQLRQPVKQYGPPADYVVPPGQPVSRMGSTAIRGGVPSKAIEAAGKRLDEFTAARKMYEGILEDPKVSKEVKKNVRALLKTMGVKDASPAGRMQRLKTILKILSGVVPTAVSLYLLKVIGGWGAAEGGGDIPMWMGTIIEEQIFYENIPAEEGLMYMNQLREHIDIGQKAYNATIGNDPILKKLTGEGVGVKIGGDVLGFDRAYQHVLDMAEGRAPTISQSKEEISPEEYKRRTSEEQRRIKAEMMGLPPKLAGQVTPQFEALQTKGAWMDFLHSKGAPIGGEAAWLKGNEKTDRYNARLMDEWRIMKDVFEARRGEEQRTMQEQAQVQQPTGGAAGAAAGAAYITQPTDILSDEEWYKEQERRKKLSSSTK